MTALKLDEFTKAYIECALWSSTDNSNEQGGDPLDRNYDVDDIAEETLESMVKDCANFQESNSELLEKWYAECGESINRAGHDFWLTRNRHGAGFWDRWNDSTPQGAIGRKLTDAANAYGGCDLYIGNDGKVYA